MFRVRALAASLAILLSPTAAQAAPILALDVVDVATTLGGGSTSGYSGANFQNRETAGRYWGDEVATGAQRFDTTQITVNRDNAAHTLTVTLRTMFGMHRTGPAPAYRRTTRQSFSDIPAFANSK